MLPESPRRANSRWDSWTLTKTREVKKLLHAGINGGLYQLQGSRSDSRHVQADFLKILKVSIVALFFIFAQVRFSRGAQKQFQKDSGGGHFVAGKSIGLCLSSLTLIASPTSPCAFTDMHSNPLRNSRHLVTQLVSSDGVEKYLYSGARGNYFEYISVPQTTRYKTSPLVLMCAANFATTRCQMSGNPAGGSGDAQISRSGRSPSGDKNPANVRVSGNLAVKPFATDYIFYVSSNGSDSNDGRSWGTAFQTVYHAIASCPFNDGCVFYLSVGSQGFINIGGPVNGQGIWLTNNNDWYFNKITAISRSGNIVTATVSGNGHASNSWSVGKVLDVFNVKEGSTSFDGTGFTVTAVGTTTVSWAQAGANESGTVSGSSHLVPAGFLYAGPIQIIGTNGQISASNSQWAGQVSLVGNSTTNIALPGIWISDSSNPIRFEGLNINGARAMQLGVSSAKDVTKTDGVSNVTFKAVSFGSSGRSGAGPTIWVAGNSFENYWYDCTVTANTTGTTAGSDNASAVLIKVPANGSLGTGEQAGILSFLNIHLNAGGIKYYQGVSGVGYIYVDGLVGEGLPKRTPAVWFPTGGATSSMLMQGLIKNAQVSDSVSGNPVVEVDIAQSPSAVTVEETQGAGVDVVGPATILGSSYLLGESTIAPEWGGQIGFWGSSSPLVLGRRVDVQRNFSPVAARFQNLASTGSAGWTTTGNLKITSGASDPDGNSNAYKVTAADGASLITYTGTKTPAAGDWTYVGGWVRSTTGNLFADGFNTWRIYCNQIRGYERLNNQSAASQPEAPVDYTGTTEWHFYFTFAKVTIASGSPCTITSFIDLNATHSIDVYAPVFIYVPAADALADNEMATYFNDLAPYGGNAPVGSIAGLPGQTWAFPGSTQFYGLLTHSNTANQTYTFPNASGTVAIQKQPLTGSTYFTASNCSSSSSPAACGSAAAGNVVIAAGATTVTVNTTAVTSNSQIFVQVDDTLNTKLGVACNSTLSTLTGGLSVTARRAGTSFQISNNGTAPMRNPLCISYHIVN
jgi:hypothetical protein